MDRTTPIFTGAPPNSTTPISFRRIPTTGGAADGDRPGIRVAVVNKHASTLTLSRVIKHAELTGADVPDAAFELLRTGKADAFASAREPLEDYAAKLPGSRVLTD